jgi:hypothetical protein
MFRVSFGTCTVGTDCVSFDTCAQSCQHKNFRRVWCLTQTRCYYITSPLHVVLTRHISFMPHTCSKQDFTVNSTTSIQTPIPSTLIGINIETLHCVKTQKTSAI